jgi:hypothetical protein
MRALPLLLAVVFVAGCSLVSLGSTKERVLARCADPLRRVDASLVEPEGQWQDQFVVVRLHDPMSGAVLFTSATIGFAAGRVDGLGWSSGGHLVLVDAKGHPREVYDVVGRRVVASVAYGEPAPADLQATTRCVPAAPKT